MQGRAVAAASKVCIMYDKAERGGRVYSRPVFILRSCYQHVAPFESTPSTDAIFRSLFSLPVPPPPPPLPALFPAVSRFSLSDLCNSRFRELSEFLHAEIRGVSRKPNAKRKQFIRGHWNNGNGLSVHPGRSIFISSLRRFLHFPRRTE